MVELNRRDFVTGVSAVCAGFCLTCGQAEADTTQPTTGSLLGGKVSVGNASDYAKNTISDKYKSSGIFISHQDDQIFAMSIKCTHKNVPQDVKSDHNSLHCKAHGSEFTEQGTVTNGPAKSSLPRFAITQDASGNLTVDKSKTFAEKKWDDPASFVKIS